MFLSRIILSLMLVFTLAPLSTYAKSINYDDALKLLSELKTWESEGEWDKFYSNKEKYQSTVKEYISSVSKETSEFYKAKFLAWRVANMFDTESRQAFDQFIIAIRDIKIEDQESILFVENVIEQLRDEERVRLKDRVASIYKELLLQAKDSKKIKIQADKFYDDGDIDSAVALYRSYLSLNEQELNAEDYFNLIEKIAYNSVSMIADAAFAEELYKKVAVKFGQESFSEAHMYLRALNLENLGSFEKAHKVYVKLTNRYPESFLKDEANYRAASISAFRLGDFDSAKNYFSKVLNNSLFDVERNLELLDGVAEEEQYNLSVFLSTISGNENLLRKNYATLRVNPAKSFVNHELNVDAMAMSSDTGCLVAAGLYLWSGDLGTYKIESNVADFVTSYENAGFRNIFLVEKSTQGILGYDSYVAAVYNAKINTVKENYLVGDLVTATVNLFPALPDEFVDIQWEIEGHGQLSANSKSVEFQFDKAGTFNIVATINYFGKNFAEVKKEITVNVE